MKRHRTYGATISAFMTCGSSMAAGLLLMASPWLTGSASDALASANATLCGMLIVFFASAALFRSRDWRNWMNLTPGSWALFSPWILGFAAEVPLAAMHVLVGLFVSIMSLAELAATEMLHLED